MIKKYLASFLCIAMLSFTFAQENEEPSFKSLDNEYKRDKLILSLSLLGQLDINSPSLSLGLDLKVNEWFGVHQELGYVNNWLNPLYSLLDESSSLKTKNKNGVKYVLEPRFYPFNKQKIFASRLFFAPSFDFRYVNIGRNEFVSRFNGSYTQKMKYSINKLAYGGLFKFGFTTKLRKFMPIDMTFGVGARYSTKYNNLPLDADVLNGNNFVFANPTIKGNQWHPSVHFGLYLHLPVNKKKL